MCLDLVSVPIPNLIQRTTAQHSPTHNTYRAHPPPRTSLQYRFPHLSPHYCCDAGWCVLSSRPRSLSGTSICPSWPNNACAVDSRGHRLAEPNKDILIMNKIHVKDRQSDKNQTQIVYSTTEPSDPLSFSPGCGSLSRLDPDLHAEQGGQGAAQSLGLTPPRRAHLSKWSGTYIQ